MEAIQVPFFVQMSLRWSSLTFEAYLGNCSILEQKTKPKCLTTACKDLSTLEAVGVAEYRLNGLHQGTSTPPMYRVPHCPFDGLHPVCDIEMPGVGCGGDGELFCAPGGLSFLTISHTRWSQQLATFCINSQLHMVLLLQLPEAAASLGVLKVLSMLLVHSLVQLF